MKKQNLFCLLFTLMCCTPGKQTKNPINLDFQLAMYPAFTSPIVLKLHKTASKGYLTVHFLDVPQTKVIFFDSIMVGKKDFDEIFKHINTAALLAVQQQPIEPGLDGISLNLNISVDGQNRHLKTWTPGRNENKNLYVLLDASFFMLYKYFKQEKKSINQAQQYLDYKKSEP